MKGLLHTVALTNLFFVGTSLLLGGSEQCNIAEKYAKYRNITKKNWQILLITILQYCVETRCHTETATLYIKFRANNMETKIKIWKCSI